MPPAPGRRPFVVPWRARRRSSASRPLAARSKPCTRWRTAGRAVWPPLQTARRRSSVHPGHEIEENQQERDRVRESVSQDGDPEVAIEYQVETSQQQTADRGIDHAGRSLIKVAHTEQNTDRSEPDDPGRRAAVAEIRNPVEDVAPIRELLSECRERPHDHEPNKQQAR